MPSLSHTQGNPVVDVTTWLIKAGLIYKYDNFEIFPMIRYLTDRYGDAEHKEKIGDYLVTDLNLSYTKRKLSFTDAAKISLQFHILLDNKYVSVINSSDDSRAGNASYYVGGSLHDSPPCAIHGILIQGSMTPQQHR